MRQNTSMMILLKYSMDLIIIGKQQKRLPVTGVAVDQPSPGEPRRGQHHRDVARQRCPDRTQGTGRARTGQRVPQQEQPRQQQQQDGRRRRVGVAALIVHPRPHNVGAQAVLEWRAKTDTHSVFMLVCHSAWLYALASWRLRMLHLNTCYYVALLNGITVTF